MMTDEDLIQLNKQGFIPGPGENAEQFSERINKSRALQEEYSKVQEEPNKVLEEACSETKRLYDIHPDWVPLVFSSSGLSFFHGACMWVMNAENSSHPLPLIQIRSKKSVLGLYSAKEILTHELIHASRIAFEEPCYEEFLCYLSSESSVRRILGPLVSSQKELWLFTGSLLLSLFLTLLAFADFQFFSWALWASLFPPLLGMMAGIRLWQRWRDIRTCQKKLKHLFKENAEAVLLRLKDQEINDFAEKPTSWVQSYIQEQDCLRWKVIKLTYSH